MSIFEVIRTQLGEMVPFATHAGVKVVSVAAGQATAELEETPTTLNHIGTQHAGALYTLGEAASGAAMAGAFAEKLMTIRPVAGEATVRYLKIARGKITATAHVCEPPEALLEKLNADGRVAFDVEVSLKNDKEAEIAAMTVKWHVKHS